MFKQLPIDLDLHFGDRARRTSYDHDSLSFFLRVIEHEKTKSISICFYMIPFIISFSISCELNVSRNLIGCKCNHSAIMVIVNIQNVDCLIFISINGMDDVHDGFLVVTIQLHLVAA